MFTPLAILVAFVAILVGRQGATVGASAPTAPATPATSAARQPITVPVDVHDMAVMPAQTVFRVGQTYRFVVTNSGKATHEMVIEPAGAVDHALQANGKPAEAEAIAPGQTKDLLWTFTKAGAFQLACHQPGHYEAGMTHAIQVTDKAIAIPVTVGDMFVKMSQPDLKPNTLYAFVVSNEGQATHELVAEQAGVVDRALAGAGEPEHAAEAENIAPGTTRELPWFFTTPGQYQLAC
ncbi:MAG TPA: plastocyanin/azurin family copper-binding protein, partial [Thermomicrobiales bacterium]|nr:plastocyanin/azurin family copper-binding protein [Thermomicrobiales bacterium]